METALVIGIPVQRLGRPGVTRRLFGYDVDLGIKDGPEKIRLPAISARRSALEASARG